MTRDVTGLEIRFQSLQSNLKNRHDLTRFRRVFLERLLSFAKEFDACGRALAAEHLLTKVEKELDKTQATSYVFEEGPQTPGFYAFRREALKTSLAAAHKCLSHFGSHMSLGERKRFEASLENWQAMGDLNFPSPINNLLQLELQELRSRLHTGLLRSIRIATMAAIGTYDAARSGTSHRNINTSEESTDSMRVIGPYNNLSNMEELIRNLAAEDPLWAEEFRELYKGLFLVQRIAGGMGL